MKLTTRESSKFMRMISLLCVICMTASLLTGCGKKDEEVITGNNESKAATQKSISSSDNDASKGTVGISSNDVTIAADHSGSNGDVDNISGSDTADDSKIKIGIAQFAEHGSLDNCRIGFIEGLKQEGFIEGNNVTFFYENAQTDGGAASQIIDNFLARKVSLICSIATPIAQAAYSAARKTDVPVVYSAVSDPILAELANDDGTPVGEVTGTSDMLPYELQLDMIREVLPEAKKIGILYCTSEVNSEATIAAYKELAGNYGFEIVEGAVSQTSDIPLVADNILEKVDCLNNITDNTVVSSLPLILNKAAKKNIPVFGSEVEQVKIGCLASIGLDYVELGIQTGKIAARILKGEKKASEINFEIIKEAAFYGNNQVAGNLSLIFPDVLTENAAEMFDTIITE